MVSFAKNFNAESLKIDSLLLSLLHKQLYSEEMPMLRSNSIYKKIFKFVG